jgi:glyoxylase-like metal-dependent hydrolase (beta-lactamase superfamily II)
VDLDHVISPAIRLTPSIGHTPGHVNVMIKSKGERAVITGDMTHHPCHLAHPDWSFGDDDPKVAALTRSCLFAEWADQPILVIGTHSPPHHGPRHLRRRSVQVCGVRTASPGRGGIDPVRIPSLERQKPGQLPPLGAAFRRPLRMYYDRYSGDHDKAKPLRNKAALSKCNQVECARQAAKK